VRRSRAMRKWFIAMSGSEGGLVEVTGMSDAEDPIDALRDALTESLKALVAAGCGPHHLKSMRWEAAISVCWKALAAESCWNWRNRSQEDSWSLIYGACPLRGIPA
jgi:hypothetical protein